MKKKCAPLFPVDKEWIENTCMLTALQRLRIVKRFAGHDIAVIMENAPLVLRLKKEKRQHEGHNKWFVFLCAIINNEESKPGAYIDLENGKIAILDNRDVIFIDTQILKLMATIA